MAFKTYPMARVEAGLRSSEAEVEGNFCIRYPSGIEKVEGLEAKHWALYGELWGGAFNDLNSKRGRDYAFYTRDALARKFGWSVRKIDRMLSALKHAGVVGVERGQRSLRYTPKLRGGIHSIKYPRLIEGAGIDFEDRILFGKLHALWQNDIGQAFCSRRYLMHELGWGRRKLDLRLKNLENLRLIDVTRKPRARSFYSPGPAWLGLLESSDVSKCVQIESSDVSKCVQIESSDVSKCVHDLSRGDLSRGGHLSKRTSTYTCAGIQKIGDILGKPKDENRKTKTERRKPKDENQGAGAAAGAGKKIFYEGQEYDIKYAAAIRLLEQAKTELKARATTGGKADTGASEAFTH